MNIIATVTSKKAHCVFGVSANGETVTYCGQRWYQHQKPSVFQKRCKHCTKELRKAGMSWGFYRVKDQMDIEFPQWAKQ